MPPNSVQFSEEVFAAILDDVAIGLSVTSACLDEDRPSKSTFFRWLIARPELVDRYDTALKLGARARVDDLEDMVEREECPKRARNRMDARKWAASKQDPKKYGDRVVTEHAGEVGVSIRTKEERDAIVAAALRADA